MESMRIIKKLTKIRNKAIFLLIIVVFIILIPYMLLVSRSIYLPHQERIINISKYKNENISVVLDSKYKNDFEVEVYDNSGKLLKASSIYNGKQNDYISGYGYYYNSQMNNKIKIKIKNKTKNFKFTDIGIWKVYPVDWKRI